jgi:UPF0755 protein
MQDEIFIIEKGDFLKGVARKLHEKNLIKNDTFFVLLAMVMNKSTVLSGKYKIYKGSSSIDIIDRLSSGDIIRKKILIPEGFNIFEISELLDNENITDGSEFLKYSQSREFINSLGIDSISIEGFLFPDTYIFAENQDSRDILFAMHKQFKSVIEDIDFSNLKKLNLNTYDLINLASLVEKEAKIPSERRYISAVFHNRLRRNMTLGCDPTIRYAVKNFKGRITYSDLKYDSPYNTYKYYGLPPGPICIPSVAGIDAVLNREDHNYMFFCAKDDFSGYHVFATTHAQHNVNARKYRRALDERNIKK